MSYDQLRRRHVADARALKPRLAQRLAWPADRLAAHRERRLRVLVQTAVAHSPWHHTRLRDLDVETLTEASLRQLPVMTKSDLMEHFDEVVTDRRATLEAVNDHLDDVESRHDGYLFDRYTAITSGGSSGVRGTLVYDWEAWATFYLSTSRQFLRFFSTLGTTDLPVEARVASSRLSHASASAGRTFAGVDFRSHLFPPTRALQQIVAGLNEVQPTLLAGYASALRSLVPEAIAGRLRIAPKRVMSASEPLLPETRRALEDAWGVRVGNMWAASEGGGLGVPCDEGHTHLSDDLFIFEFVESAGNPTSPGDTSAKVLLTNLYNYAQPLIRYEITDQVMVERDGCSCGSAHRRIADISGRQEDAFVYGDVTVHPLVFAAPLELDRGVMEYQVQQTDRGAAVAVRCDGAPDLERLRNQLVQGLQRVGLRSVDVSIERVDHILRQASGKLKRLIPLPQPRAA
ncbi:MAG: phenylacetate--CoA ligase family protein [Candidatus Dormibacteraeota bacterium]|nr:phenylacetate--CoA ligase family protein [Candidatus Dormibacteraeota bacterium]